MATLGQPIGINDQWDVTLRISPERVLEGNDAQLEVTLFHPSLSGNPPYGDFLYAFDSPDPRIRANLAPGVIRNLPGQPNVFAFTVPNLPEGSYEILVTVTPTGSPPIIPTFPPRTVSASFFVVPRQVQAAVTLQRTGTFPTDDQALWVAIRNRTSALDFVRYQRFINRLFCVDDSLDISQLLSASQRVLPIPQQLQAASGIPQDDQRLSIYGPYAYSLLKLATQVFLTLECGVVIRNPEGGNSLFRIEDEFIRLNDFTVSLSDLQTRLERYLAPFDSQALPYLDRIVPALVTLDPERTNEVLPYCFGILQHRLICPALLELIWSYWHEEGMLVQTMNAIAYRFQNRRSGPRDPLGELELDPLRPLNNLIWGLIQDEHNRLTVSRRAYEYDHHYGLQLVGKAVPSLASADSRSKFIEAFHNLLYRNGRFLQGGFRHDSDRRCLSIAEHPQGSASTACRGGAQSIWGSALDRTR